MKQCFVIVMFCLASITSALSIDRQAFTITRYRLDVSVDRKSQVMAVTGRLVLRNDSKSPQDHAALQISSSLQWNGISTDNKLEDCNCVGFPGDRKLEWIGDNYTSDIDHTGSLSEAIITLPKAVPPAASIALDVQYGGTITPDATRLTRVGTPADMAARSDWDNISDNFTTVRGLGYVVWYPVAIGAVSMSDGNAVFDAIAQWKARHRKTEFFAYVGVVVDTQPEQPCALSNLPTSATWRVGVGASPQRPAEPQPGAPYTFGMTLQTHELDDTVPTIAILPDCTTLSRPTVAIVATAAHSDLAKNYALAAEANDPLLHDWLGEPREPARVIELTEPKALPYQSGSILFTPLRPWPTDTLQLLLLSTQVTARFQASHAWIEQGLQRFLQTVSVESRSGRKAALEYLDDFREPLAKSEEVAHPKADTASKAPSESPANNTLLNTTDELYLRGKGSFVFWMLRDMLGDTAVQTALARYRAGADKDPGYLQRLLESSSKRDLEWFFDDWVYRDRGLPDFRVQSSYARPLLSENNQSYLETITVENRGHAGAEVPVIVQTPSGEKSVRVLVKAGEKGTGRIELPVAADKIVVNDGSVPDSNLDENVYNVPASKE